MCTEAFRVSLSDPSADNRFEGAGIGENQIVVGPGQQTVQNMVVKLGERAPRGSEGMVYLNLQQMSGNAGLLARGNCAASGPVASAIFQPAFSAVPRQP